MEQKLRAHFDSEPTSTRKMFARGPRFVLFSFQVLLLLVRRLLRNPGSRQRFLLPPLCGSGREGDRGPRGQVRRRTSLPTVAVVHLERNAWRRRGQAMVSLGDLQRSTIRISTESLHCALRSSCWCVSYTLGSTSSFICCMTCDLLKGLRPGSFGRPVIVTGLRRNQKDPKARRSNGLLGDYRR